MARRRQGAAIDFLDAVAMLPWWGGIALALASHVLFDRLSVPASTPMQAGPMGAFVQQALVAGFASIGRWLVPLLCLLGAGVSFMRRRRRRSLVGTVTGSDAASALDGMTWREFELLVGEAFRRQGWQVTEQGGVQADGGVDLVLRMARETFVVQCKQWKAFKVGVGVVRDLYGVMAARGAAGGFVVTSGRFTAEARRFAEGRNVSLIDGPALLALIRPVSAMAATSPAASSARARPATGRAATGVRPAPTPDSALASASTTMAPCASAPASSAPMHAGPAPTGDLAAPACPTCDAAMVRRMARTGARAGSSFWGCSRFPSCRGTR
jgi:restriction system protein